MLIDMKTIVHRHKMDIGDVLHVGAHKAEESPLYSRFSKPQSQVWWVEANPALYRKLLLRSDLGPNNHFINCAATDIDDEMIEFNIANNGESSSIYELGTHKQEHPEVQYESKISVRTRTIDSLREEYGFNVNFLNLDIQGAELIALQGANDTLWDIDYVYTEVNRKPLYKGCGLIREIDQLLHSYEFDRVETEWTVHGWGDALYVKRNLS